jgi:FolB domain-containing protein
MPPSAAFPACLSLRQLRLPVRLGVGEEERAMAQDVLVDIDFYYELPPACAEDDSGDYLCYHQIAEEIRLLLASRPFRLIEFLTMEIYRRLRVRAPEGVKLRVMLRKPAIGLGYVEGGAGFCYSDMPCGAGAP